MKELEKLIARYKLELESLEEMAGEATDKNYAARLNSQAKVYRAIIPDLNAIEDRWIPVDKDNLPKGEVLAYAFHREMLFGYLSYELDMVFCENDSEILTDVTHYRIPTPPKG